MNNKSATHHILLRVEVRTEQSVDSVDIRRDGDRAGSARRVVNLGRRRKRRRRRRMKGRSSRTRRC